MTRQARQRGRTDNDTPTSTDGHARLERLAKRAARFHTSPWSMPMDLDGRHPAPVSLSSGAPAESLVPVERLTEAAATVWAEPNQWAYAGLAGYHPLREWLAEWLRARQFETSADNIVLLTGSQQGIDLVARIFLDDGDTVIVEGPTYIGALQVFDSFGARYLTIPMDDDGMDTDALEAALAERQQRHEPTPKLLYTVPTFQNPTGRLTSDSRRDAMLAIARQYEIVVVEDDPYGELFFGQPPPRSLQARDDDVISLGTFSKTLAPALRLGWAVLPTPLVDLVANAREVNDVHGDRMTQRVVAYTVNGFLDDHIAWLRGQYARRRDRLLAALDEYLPEDVCILRPEGGFFVWLDLPDGMDAVALMPDAADHGILYLPGSWAFPDRRASPGIRLSFANAPEEWLDEGAKRLGTAIRAALAVRERAG